MLTRLKVFGTEDTVLRPIIITVLEDIVKFFGFKKEDTYFHLDENSNIIKAHKNNKNSPITNIIKNNRQVIKVESFKETAAEGHNNNLLLLFPAEKSILIDDDVDFRAMFIKQWTKVELEVSLIVQDKVTLQAALDMIKTNAAYSSGVLGHNLQYTVNAPKFLRNLLYVINYYKNKMEPEDKKVSLKDYITSISDDRLNFLASHDGDINKASVSYRERQMSVQGLFDGNLEDLSIEEADGNAYSISLNYSFDYEKILALNVEYPIYVYNQRMPKEFFNVFKHEEQMNYESKYGVMSKFYNLYGKYPRTFGGGIIKDTLVLPPHDKRLPEEYPSYYCRILTQLMRVDPDNPKELININQIQGIRFKPQVERLILGSEREFVGSYKRSLYWIAVYENDKLLTKNSITIDAEGNMVLDKEMDMKKTYRLAVFLLTNIMMLGDQDRDRLKVFLNKEHEQTVAIRKQRMDTDGTNKSFLEHSVNSKNTTLLINPYTITNPYLSNLETLIKVNRLNKQEINKIVSEALPPVESYYNIISQLGKFPDIDRYTQLMSIFYCLDTKDKEK